MFILLGVETALFFIHVAMAVRNLVNVHTSHWVIIWCSILRILIVTSFYLEYSTQISQVFEDIQSFLFCVYLLIGLLSLAYEIICFLWETTKTVIVHLPAI
jgi:hypothetical protein